MYLCKRAYQAKNELLEQLDEERAKNRILESKIHINGGNKMAELTQWEYKYVSADLQEMSKAGEQGWEATGNSNFINLINPWKVSASGNFLTVTFTTSEKLVCLKSELRNLKYQTAKNLLLDCSEQYKYTLVLWNGFNSAISLAMLAFLSVKNVGSNDLEIPIICW